MSDANPVASISRPNEAFFPVLPKESGTHFSSAGGGEFIFDPSYYSWFNRTVKYITEEMSRPLLSSVVIQSPDHHIRPPMWFEDKNVAVDGSPLSIVEKSNKNIWSNKYEKELDVAEAVQAVRKQKRFEQQHDVIGFFSDLRRRLGFAVPLDEAYAAKRVEAKYDIRGKLLSEQQQQTEDGSNTPSSSSQMQAETEYSLGTLVEITDEKKSKMKGLQKAWEALLESAETGKPLAKVARGYRPRIDFYGLDPFLDSSFSVIWFSCKCGIAFGLAHGSCRAVQAMNSDIQFLRASGVGVLTILNMSIFSSVVKWGGNATLFSGAFCIGDRLAKRVKYMVLPEHDAKQRSIANYATGLALSGSTVSILPWWILNDTALAFRLGISGMFLGGVLGIFVGVALSRLVSLNLSRIDASNRELRRYEALILRQRQWSEEEKERQSNSRIIWW